MEPDRPSGLSTAALVAIACNTCVAFLLLLLCLILYRACRVPSCPDSLAVLAQREPEAQQMNEHNYLLTSWLQTQRSRGSSLCRMRALKELEDGREEHVMTQVDLLLFDTRNSDILKERMRAQHGSRWYPATFSLSSGEKEDLPSSFGVSQLLLDVSISIRASAGTLSCFFFVSLLVATCYWSRWSVGNSKRIRFNLILKNLRASNFLSFRFINDLVIKDEWTSWCQCDVLSFVKKRRETSFMLQMWNK